jgi:ribosome-binding factor A
MSQEYSRSQRIADQMQKYLAELIQNNLKDPRVAMVTITAVVVSKELDLARIYFSSFSLDSDSSETLEGLTRAAGFLRSALAKRMKLRTTPKLKFILDESVEYGNHLSTLIDSAMKQPSNNSDQDETA